ncbi:MAG: DHHW family protein [Oscillibacter sp.]
MKKFYNRFLTAVFCLFLGGLFVWHVLLPDRARSEVENRTLQQLPVMTLSGVLEGSYMDDMETYFADQFPLRDDWTEVKARAEQLLGKREFNNVYLCGDTLISKVKAPEETLTDKNLAYTVKLAEKTDIPVYLGLIPSAADIWKDKLPVGGENWDQTAFLALAAEKTGLPTVDFKTALADHAAEPIFYRTDHHWTSLGAYYGYTAVMEALGRTPLDRGAFTPETVSEDFNGTLYSTSGIHWLPPDSMEFWVPDAGLSVTSWRTGKPVAEPLYNRDYLEKKDKYSAFLGGNQPLCVIENQALAGQGKLLVVRDSYSDSLAPLLSQSFEEVHLLDLRYYHSSVAQYARDNGIDQIVVLYSVPNFVTDLNLVFLGQ